MKLIEISNRRLPLSLNDAFLDLFCFSFLKPSFDLINLLLRVPVVELCLTQVKHFPALVFHQLRCQSLQSTRLEGSLGRAQLLQVIVDGNLLLVENVMQVEQVVQRHENDREH